jgi:GNAT superfamily N-acetyltransferase
VIDLAGLFEAAERGEYPPTDLSVTHLPAPKPGTVAVLGFTAHTVVATDADPAWIAAHLPPGDPGAAFNPPFLGALEGALGLRVNNIDILALAPPRSGPPHLALQRIDDQTHPRVRRALRYRDDVTVWSCGGGVLVLGRGLGGRWEVAVEVEPDARGKGLGRALAAAAAHLVPENRPVWAEIGVGNAASVRAFLAAGYLPVGEEALLVSTQPS